MTIDVYGRARLRMTCPTLDGVDRCAIPSTMYASDRESECLASLRA